MLRALSTRISSHMLKCRSVSNTSKWITAQRMLSNSSNVCSNNIKILDLPLENVSIKKKIRKANLLEDLKTDQTQLKQMLVASTAEAYNLEDLAISFSNKWPYKELDISEDIEDNVVPYECLDQSNEQKRIFFFREGSVACWNMSKREIDQIFEFLKPFEMNPYDQKAVMEEKEEMDYRLIDGKTRLFKGIFHLNLNSNEQLLEQYAFSNALALSVKLAVLESSLNSYVGEIKFITEDMMGGKKMRLTRDQVFKKTGSLFALRHHINLSSDLLDTPDFYWDRQDLEHLFQSTCNFLNINKRTKVMNEKLNHCTELMALLSHHLNDQHHVRLELMIIALILIEVFSRFYSNY